MRFATEALLAMVLGSASVSCSSDIQKIGGLRRLVVNETEATASRDLASRIYGGDQVNNKLKYPFFGR